VGYGKLAKELGCCERFKDKRKPCKDCPLMKKLPKDERKKLLAKY
jgi:hypothetical protein